MVVEEKDWNMLRKQKGGGKEWTVHKRCFHLHLPPHLLHPVVLHWDVLVVVVVVVVVVEVVVVEEEEEVVVVVVTGGQEMSFGILGHCPGQL